MAQRECVNLNICFWELSSESLHSSLNRLQDHSHLKWTNFSTWSSWNSIQTLWICNGMEWLMNKFSRLQKILQRRCVRNQWYKLSGESIWVCELLSCLDGSINFPLHLFLATVLRQDLSSHGVGRVLVDKLENMALVLDLNSLPCPQQELNGGPQFKDRRIHFCKSSEIKLCLVPDDNRGIRRPLRRKRGFI